jgi:radical SAM superfamily enzyme YgiQ (UPF0313 family)
LYGEAFTANGLMDVGGCFTSPYSNVYNIALSKEILMRIRERNLIRKDWRKASLRIALCYPGSYRSGMSGLAIQTLYGLFNSRDDFLAERFFEGEGPPMSIESGRPLSEFDVIAFTLQFEGQYASVIAMLASGGVEPVRKRGRRQLVVGGGPCATANPFILSDVFDLFVLGEVEPVFEELCSALSVKGPRGLDGLIGERGFYVPGTSDGGERAFAQDLDRVPHVVRQIVADACAPEDMPVFGKSLMVETCRGCPISCKFCLSSRIYSPFRFRSPSSLLKVIRRGLADTGVDRVVLIGSGTSLMPGIDRVLTELIASGLRVSIPSLLPQLLLRGSVARDLASSGLRSVTLAPEAGCSLRLRVGKRIDDDSFIEAASLCREVGLKKLKLYFLTGLPSETTHDLDELLDLAGLMHDRGPPNISASLNVFVPKPQTPFQWARPLVLKDVKGRYALLRKGLARLGWPFSGSGARGAAAQSVLSLGGAEIGNMLVESVTGGSNWFTAIYGLYRRGYVSPDTPWSTISPSDNSRALFEYEEFLKGASA